MLKKLYSSLARPSSPTAQAAYANLIVKALARTTAALVFLALLVASLNFLISTAHAGGGGALKGGATELTQMMNNAELALQSVEEQIQTIESIERTYLARLQQLSSSIGEYTAPFRKAYSMYQRVNKLHTRLTGLGEKLENFDQTLDARFKEFAASQLTWNDWMLREQKLVQQNDEAARARLAANREVLTSLSDSLDAYQKAAEGMEDTSGVHQAVRQLAPLLQTLGGDVNKLIAVTAQENYSRDLERQERAADKQRVLDENDKLRKRQQEANEKSRSQFDKMIKSWRPPTKSELEAMDAITIE